MGLWGLPGGDGYRGYGVCLEEMGVVAGGVWPASSSLRGAAGPADIAAITHIAPPPWRIQEGTGGGCRGRRLQGLLSWGVLTL